MTGPESGEQTPRLVRRQEVGRGSGQRARPGSGKAVLRGVHSDAKKTGNPAAGGCPALSAGRGLESEDRDPSCRPRRNRSAGGPAPAAPSPGPEARTCPRDPVRPQDKPQPKLQDARGPSGQRGPSAGPRTLAALAKVEAARRTGRAPGGNSPSPKHTLRLQRKPPPGALRPPAAGSPSEVAALAAGLGVGRGQGPPGAKRPRAGPERPGLAGPGWRTRGDPAPRGPEG